MLRALHLMAFATAPLLVAAGENERIFTERIAPVLARNCASCHGGGQPAGDLAVDSLENLLRGGKHGPAIQSGAASESLLVAHLTG